MTTYRQRNVIMARELYTAVSHTLVSQPLSPSLLLSLVLRRILRRSSTLRPSSICIPLFLRAPAYSGVTDNSLLPMGIPSFTPVPPGASVCRYYVC